ncbi:murein hydrolase activator EnvC family protein [Rhizomicrobium electricum]|jgi:murein DD-endopeptidase MepM/ murein hydrolase activator NlpD|uniref:M23ase beta-sheet core domain-containing protein n=1 Tax=Rhizomicrobium electricum TaxID=480070 RepID=A0ABN1EBR2_9PROT|nr:M23 family metallopeptidase [Rhizomicrobium electricum]NIJ48170.1 murein DD-endopeptidase MepM/ murein hydrolase activator NlpD [Rhizomicrobium electricum]
MVRRGNAEYRIFAVAAAVILPLLAAGCTTTPEPYFGWDVQTTKSRPHRVAAVKPKPRPNPTYYESQYTDNRYYDDRSYDRGYSQTPTPRPSQKWYDRPAERNDDSDYRPASRPNYAGDARFQWPVRGRVLSEFGASPGGEKNNGINIAATQGEPIRAAADGNVSYAGNELRGYGNLVLIKHDNGYITAYAHADHFVVDKGQWVARGQVIGYVGTTGDVRTPQLHFEVRRGNHGETPVDPRQILGSQRVAYR